MEVTTLYMYLFVREDLSKPQQIVQTAHAVDEINKHLPQTTKGNYMVLCDVKSEKELLDVSMHLFEEGVNHHLFFEPDIDSYTAIATVPLKGSERKPMKRYNTMA